MQHNKIQIMNTFNFFRVRKKSMHFQVVAISPTFVENVKSQSSDCECLTGTSDLVHLGHLSKPSCPIELRVPQLSASQRIKQTAQVGSKAARPTSGKPTFKFVN